MSQTPQEHTPDPAASAPGAAPVALVSGATRGIGRQIAAQLARRGMTALVGARDAAAGERAAAEIRDAGGRAHAVVLDVTDAASVAAARAWIADRFDRLDVLVNNAGIAGDMAGQAPGSADPDVVRAVFDTNVFGAVALTEAVWDLLLRAPAARIVNVSSDVGSLTQALDPGHYLSRLPGFLAYGPSKTALNAITVQYAKALAGHGVLVNAAVPGACDTDLTRGTGMPAPRTAAQGAEVAVRLATLPEGGPTGGCFGEDREVPW
ncbi:SDR family NAD(P)-dependent oxidoreductase [Streptomonospora nanhaiensis]|uniref:SDR family NAD(P)-dependent oxidoreductase n=1 Tax=Streptomonospora nanhaiensis TaxID=1323731 RepID=UPI001C385295|nr:SDR family NAD(P)-dependent oxidoreductase [Streptomonospora nanhaiensis]MBV2366416.1 SDR family NAD(P)-dependent oxidoreductase [Streptomonospora nanhaiensis]MBX9389959.1 SDR family NAD(P)-dependent oxidoreductase [Streptomonospora nanhaiensis]